MSDLPYHLRRIADGPVDAIDADYLSASADELERLRAAMQSARDHQAKLIADAVAQERERWAKNSRETFEAMVAMRNTINEHIPMPSLESDLLQGPDGSVFCATIAEAVVSYIRASEGGQTNENQS